MKKAKKRQYLTKNAQDMKQKQKISSKKERLKAQSGKIMDYISPERIIKDYREKQKSYTIYKRTVIKFRQ